MRPPTVFRIGSLSFSLEPPILHLGLPAFLPLPFTSLLKASKNRLSSSPLHTPVIPAPLRECPQPRVKGQGDRPALRKCLTLGPHPLDSYVVHETASLLAQFSHLSASGSSSFSSHRWAGPSFDLHLPALLMTYNTVVFTPGCTLESLGEGFGVLLLLFFEGRHPGILGP